jgi:hypothetical protein
MGRPVSGPAHPVDQAARQRLQGHALAGGLLARRPGQPATAAGLRHGVAHQSRPHGIPASSCRSREARPPQARRRTRPLLLPGRNRFWPPGFPPQGRRAQARDGGLRPSAAHRGRLPLRRHAAHLQGGAVPHLRAPAVLRRHDVPAHADGGVGLLPQGDELPDAQPHLPVARAVLPRPADAAVRVRVGLSLREVRRRPWAHAGARVCAGRLALVRHQGAGRRRDQAPAQLRALGLLRDFGL